MPLSDRTKRKLDYLIGIGSSDEIISLVQDAATASNPSFTGSILIGGAGDQVGFYGTSPIPIPLLPAPGAPTAVLLTYVGTPDTALGDSGNPDDNNRLASLAAQINNLINDLATVRTSVDQIQADLVDLGLIQGSTRAGADRTAARQELAVIAP